MLDANGKMKTWEPAHPTFEKLVAIAKRVFSCKKLANEYQTMNRGRIVAKRFSRKDGINCDWSFAPVSKYTTLRYFLAFKVF